MNSRFTSENWGLFARCSKEVTARFKNAGGLYNYGNLIIPVAVAGEALLTNGHELRHGLQAFWEHFASGPSSGMLTLATVIFFWGGEKYHQAWASGFPPDKEKNAEGDFLSGVGAGFLGAGLAMQGSLILAATSGVVHAAGKFGSLASKKTSYKDFFTQLVLASRAPALIATGMDIHHNVVSLPPTQAAVKSIVPVGLAGAYGLWTRADYALLPDTSLTKRTMRRMGIDKSAPQPS
jgi:hypothetical protein